MLKKIKIFQIRDLQTIRGRPKNVFTVVTLSSCYSNYIAALVSSMVDVNSHIYIVHNIETEYISIQIFKTECFTFLLQYWYYGKK